jgi:tRNA (adenine57-N1/adenine58-N1)-methyltransferase catalytic subunit
MAVTKMLISDDGKRFYVKNPNEDFHTQFGFVKSAEISAAKPGDIVKTNTGKELSVFEPDFVDLYYKIKRAPQIIPLKDVAAIISITGIGKESRIVDAGTGSGALSLFLANIAKEVVTYELREDFAKVAQENIDSLEMKNVKVKNKNIYDGIDEKNVDVVTLDLPEPWKAVEPAIKALKVGGFLVSYSPTTPQVSDFVAEANKHGCLVLIKTIEIIEREWEFRERVVRPLSQQIGHSGFLTFVRMVKK